MFSCLFFVADKKTIYFNKYSDNSIEIYEDFSNTVMLLKKLGELDNQIFIPKKNFGKQKSSHRFIINNMMFFIGTIWEIAL